MDSGNESDDEHIYTEMLEDIHDVIQFHTGVNRRDTRYKIRDRIKQRQSEYKQVLKSTQSMGKCSHKVFQNAVK